MRPPSCDVTSGNVHGTLFCVSGKSGMVVGGEDSMAASGLVDYGKSLTEDCVGCVSSYAAMVWCYASWKTPEQSLKSLQYASG